MKNTLKMVVISIIIIVALIACEDDPVKNDEVVFNNTLDIYLGELYQNGIEPDSLKVYLTYLTGDNANLKYTLSKLESVMKVDLVFSAELKTTLLIKAFLYYGDSVKTAYSEYCLTEDNENTVIGELRAKYYHQNVILKLDTNPAETVEVSDYYDYEVLDNFFKEYQIENVDLLADTYLSTPMKFMIDNRILYDILDENNIPFMPYDFGDYYNPVFTCNNAFACFDEYLRTGDELYLEWFYANADWLIDYRDSNSLLRYEFAFQHENISLQVGWTSAMAQGQALGTMCMAYHNSGDVKYLQAADDFFATMHTNIGTDWNVFIDSEDYLWYEEYPSKDFCHVLNGKLFGMWGLWDYYCITRNPDALRLLQGGLASILDNYPLWDVDGVDGSHYCCHTTSISSYHRIHKQQLAAYRDMFNIEEFDIILNTFTNDRND